MYAPTDEFGDPEFITLNKTFFDKYINLRVHGHAGHQAFLKVFGQDHLPDNARAIQMRLDAIEGSAYFQQHFTALLESTPVSELWSPKKSLNELLCIVRGPWVKDSVKLAAAKELNIMVGIVIVDENGKTKAGRSLADFYDGPDVQDGAKPTATNPSEVAA